MYVTLPNELGDYMYKYLSAALACIALTSGSITGAPAAAFSEKPEIRQTSSWGLDRIDGTLDSLFTSTGTGGGVRIYVLDTGVDAKHPELLGRVVDGYDAFGQNLDQTDCNGHGTHIAAVAAGNIHGVAPRATIVPVRILNCNSQGNTGTLAAGINWILDNHPKGDLGVVNMSFAGQKSQTIDTSVSRLLSAGIITVAAAGNFSDDACKFSPANIAGVITVGATAAGDYRLGTSNWGSCVDIFAPGSRILSANSLNYGAPSSRTGTSQAAPYVAGALATYISNGAITTSSAALSVLIATAEPEAVLDAKSSNNYFLRVQKESTLVGNPSLVDPVSDVVTVGASIPLAPRNFSIKYNKLAWQAPANASKCGTITYVVQQKFGESWRSIATTLENYFTLKSSETSSTSIYRVIASNSVGTSGPTLTLKNIGADGAALIAPIPALPEDIKGSVKAVQGGARSAVVHISWAGDPEFIEYTIEIAPIGTNYWKLVRTTKTTQSMATQTPGRKVVIKVTGKTNSGSMLVIGVIQYEGLR
jgi:hypothetical protein